MRDTKERLSVLWLFALLNYLYADVLALFAIAGTGNSFEASSPMGFDGFSGLDGNTHRHDSGMSSASVQGQPVGENHRGRPFDPRKRIPDLRSASGWMGQAACSSRVLVLRNDRNCGHLGHHLAGVDLVTQERRTEYELTLDRLLRYRSSAISELPENGLGVKVSRSRTIPAMPNTKRPRLNSSSLVTRG